MWRRGTSAALRALDPVVCFPGVSAYRVKVSFLTFSEEIPPSPTTRNWTSKILPVPMAGFTDTWNIRSKATIT